MSKLKICEECEIEFDPSNPKHAGGYIGLCGDCDEPDVVKSIGLIDALGKTDVRVSIIKNPSPAEIKMVETQGRCGPGHCHTSLGLQSNGANTPKKTLDKIEKKG